METVLEMDFKDIRLSGAVGMHVAWDKDQWRTFARKKKVQIP
jgi:hypothetical protein